MHLSHSLVLYDSKYIIFFVSSRRRHTMYALVTGVQTCALPISDEFVDVAEALWSAWDRDALVRDTANNVYIDPAKVREINHRGKYFKVRGPLNQVPSPQGKPVLMQAGASPRGRD